MADLAWRPGASPGWADIRLAVTWAAQACADAVTALCVRGDPDGAAAQLAEHALAVLAGTGEQLRGLEFGEALVEAEAERRAEEMLAAAGMAPPRPRRHLHAVS